MKSKAQILADYTAATERWIETKGDYVDIRPVNLQDVFYIGIKLHPTNRAESKEMTWKIIDFLCEVGIASADDIYARLGFSDKPVLRRLKIMRIMGLVRRESKRFYLATPRMRELKKRYYGRL